ncbi:MAG: hypothetical protein OEY86_07260 [Nitrospira sp.]|nr:hypothetical protein [Nitrospira sp.]
MDLAHLPCEVRYGSSNDNEGHVGKRFFYPLEFDKYGQLVYRQQANVARDAVKDILLSDSINKHVVVIVHGWDKPIGLAEHDFQDFICRFRNIGMEIYDLGNEAPNRNRLSNSDDLMVIGVFWPSTVNPNLSDSVFKPFTYHLIRNRADSIASSVGNTLTSILTNAHLNRIGDSHIPQDENSLRPRLTVIGHSFGGRILRHVLDDEIASFSNKHSSLFDVYKEVNTILLLAAMSPPSVEGIRTRLYNLNEYTKAKHRYQMYTVFSQNDWANRFLYPLGEALSFNRPYCAIGACGESSIGKGIIPASNDGEFCYKDMPPNDRFYNVDASAFIFDHGDIYKGRVARLIWGLLENEDTARRDKFPLCSTLDGSGIWPDH